MNRPGISLGLLLLLVSGASAGAGDQIVPRWARFELRLEGIATYKNPSFDPTVKTTFTSPSGKTHETIAVWAGAREWLVRFSPNEEGRWSWRTRLLGATDAGLDGRSGTFICAPNKDPNRLFKHGALEVSANHRHFQHADGTPFFWLADTAWNGALKADAKSWDVYLRDRAGKGFNVIQIVATPWRSASGNADARPAYYSAETLEIEPAFWSWMDERVSAINDRGMVAAMVVLWAIGGKTASMNPGHALPEAQAIQLSRYIVARYAAHHVTYFLAGDGKYLGKEAERWRRIGTAVFDGLPSRPTTMHPGGQTWVYDEFRREPWFSYNGYQTGHSTSDAALKWMVDGPASRAWATQPVHPHVNLEANYEAHLERPIGKPFDAFAVRRASYFSLLATPPAGITYGAHGIWSWETKAGLPMTHPYAGVAPAWTEALKLPGAAQMKHLAAFFRTLAWWTLQPDPTLLVQQPGEKDPKLFMAAARAADGKLAVIYIPTGGRVQIDLSRIAGQATVAWFDPESGRLRSGEKAANTGRRVFVAPAADRDWVLLLRASAPRP